MPERRPRRLHPRVRDLVAADRQARRPAGRLPSEQIDQLVAVARGDEDFDAPVSAARALRALPAHAGRGVATRVLEEAVLAEGRPLSVRIAAAQTLGDVGTDEAETALLRAADSDDTAVQLATLEALGRCGGRRAAARLADLPEPRDVASRRQLAFARALIAHRQGVRGVTVPAARPNRRPVPAAGRTAVELRAEGLRETAQRLQRLRGTTWGVDVAERALQLRCGATTWSILLARDTRPDGVLPTALLERPLVAAVLAQDMPTGERLTSRYAVLSRPDDDGRAARLDVVRADGTVVYTGRARPQGRALALEISDVDRPGTAPTRLSARLTPEGAEVLDVSAVGSRVGGRSTTDVRVR